MQLEDKRIVVTGGATSIGKATAIACAGDGARVVVADVNAAAAEETVTEIRSGGGEGWFVRTDVSEEAEVASLMAAAEEYMGGLNALVTAAGIARDSLVPVAAKYAVPAMRRAGQGVIVMIASGAGVRVGSSIVAYGASKGGVNGLAMTLERALAEDNIRVNALCPGSISTPLKLGIIENQVERIGEAANREQADSRSGNSGGCGEGAEVPDLRRRRLPEGRGLHQVASVQKGAWFPCQTGR